MKTCFLLLITSIMYSYNPTSSYYEGVGDTLSVLKHSKEWPKKKVDLVHNKVSYYTVLDKYSGYFNISKLTNKQVVFYISSIYKMGYNDIFIAHFGGNKNIFIPYGNSLDDLIFLKNKLFKELNLEVEVSKFNQVLDVIPFIDFLKYRSDVFSFYSIPHKLKVTKRTKNSKVKKLDNYMKIYEAIMNNATITNDDRLLLFKKFYSVGDNIGNNFYIDLIDKSTDSVIISGSKLKVPNL